MEVRREQLLDAAIRVIVREGYDGVSVESIAREAGVTRPVVYGAFDGLGPLLGALLDRQQARALEQLATAFPADAADPAEAMLAAVRTMAERVRSDPLTWQPILAAPQATPDVVRERIDADRELVRGHLQGLLAAVAPPGLDVELAAHALVATLEYFGRVLVEDPDRFDVERLVGFAAAMMRIPRGVESR
jgi:AcrR family transcriptional regulator